MKYCGVVSKRMIKATVLALFLSFTSPAYTFADDATQNLPFDPSKIEMDESWEEKLIGEGVYFTWCGNKHLLVAVPYLLGAITQYRYEVVNIDTLKSKNLPNINVHNFDTIFCTPDGRHIVVDTSQGSGELTSIDSRTMKIVAKINPKSTDVVRSQLSPDGKMLAMEIDGKLPLGGKEFIRIIPALKGATPSDMRLDVAWGQDSKKFFILSHSGHLLIYDVISGKRKAIKLKIKGTWPSSIYSVENRLYFFIPLNEYGDGTLAVLSIDKINNAKNFLTPKPVTDNLYHSSLSRHDSYILNLGPKTDTPEMTNPLSDSLYLVDREAKNPKRLPSSYWIYSPAEFSRDGKAIAYGWGINVRGRSSDSIRLKFLVNVLIKHE